MSIQDYELKLALRIKQDEPLPKIVSDLYEACQYAVTGISGNTLFSVRELAIIAGCAKFLMDRGNPTVEVKEDEKTTASIQLQGKDVVDIPAEKVSIVGLNDKPSAKELRAEWPEGMGVEVKFADGWVRGQATRYHRTGKLAIAMETDPDGKSYRLFEIKDVRAPELAGV